MKITLVHEKDGWHIQRDNDGVIRKTKRGRPTRLLALCDYMELEDKKQGELS